MHLRKRHILGIVALLVVLAFVPEGKRTIRWAGSADGLITLAMTLEAEHSFNPFNRDSNFVSPDMAVWILDTFEWPYERNVDAEMPPLHGAITAHGLVGRDPKDLDRMMRLVEIMVSRGEDVNEYSENYTPLLLAIMYCEPDIVHLLLKAGADTSLPFRKKGSPAEGLDALEFAKFLQRRSERVQCDSNIPAIISR